SLCVFISCNGSDRKYNNPMHELLFGDDSGTETVVFKIAGQSMCAACDLKDVLGVEIEIYPAENATNSIASASFDFLGPFEFKNLRFIKGAKIVVEGLLRFKDPDITPLNANMELEVPDKDDELLTPVISFQK
ncbi:MAG: hypothetical protein ABIE74_09910, partial [Pseudomonadota bacterium]